MTISKSASSDEGRARPPQGSYDPNYDPRPTQICLGISLITVEEETFIQDSRTVTCPVDDDIHYITVDRKLIEVPNKSCIRYDVVAELLEKEGYPRRMWKIMHCWEATNTTDEPF